MTHSKRRVSTLKPVKPDWRKSLGLHPDFPLFPLPAAIQPGQPDRRRWCKKVRGKLRYFGKVADDPKGAKALELWLEQKDDLLAGREPRVKGDGLTIADLCNRFLTSKDRQLAAGELTKRTRADYQSACDRIVAQFGRLRLVTDLAADDFELLRASIAKNGGPVHLGNIIQKVRTVFKYAYDSGLIDRPVRYGPAFRKPGRRALRLDKAERGERLFSAGEVRRLLAAADVHLRAMVYLALNCAYGNSDVGTLPIAALDLDNGWATYHRRKTGVPRRCPLWPQTVRALRRSLAKRPAPKNPDDAGLVFVTKYGASWSKETVDNPVTKAFRKLLDALGLHRPGLGFYTLRHVFRTVADASGDQVAANAIMGHVDSSMAGVYRERIDDSRLRAVTDHVRQWLNAKPTRKGVRHGQ